MGEMLKQQGQQLPLLLSKVLSQCGVDLFHLAVQLPTAGSQQKSDVIVPIKMSLRMTISYTEDLRRAVICMSDGSERQKIVEG